MRTGRGERYHISIFGPTNSGKSTLLNALLKQNISIVSPQKGTTTDPVHKNFELLDAGPVVFIDTAGFGDDTLLGTEREEASKKIITKTDLALITLDATDIQYDLYKTIAKECARLHIESWLIFTKSDCLDPLQLEELQDLYPDAQFLSALNQEDIDLLLTQLTQHIISKNQEHKLIGDLLPYRSRVVLVIPIDSEAPKGRIINPQVQVIRDALDHGLEVIIVRDTELEQTLKNLNYQVDLVVTDSQVFQEVSKIVPEHIYLTGFSILFIRYKGELKTFVEGLSILKTLTIQDKVAIVESCSHNISCEDIGRFKIPTLLKKFLGFQPSIDFFTGSDFPSHPEKYKLVIHCGACMTNRQTVLSRMTICLDASVLFINYGILLAYGAGILERSLKIFKDKGLY
ncbi:MAG: [FeFe] hydrogenase H-cluster maturation GTPase HydF [Brevinema sp.]